MSETEKVEKEADHHPYFRPKDAATLILVDRTSTVPKVLVGKRHDKVVFMPGKFVFPGGRVDKSDNRIPVAAPMPEALQANLFKGSPRTSASRAKSLAIAAMASDFARDADVLGLPLNRLASKSPGMGAATGTRWSDLSTRPPGKTNLPGMNTTLSWRLPTSTFGTSPLRSIRIRVAASLGFV